MRARVTVEVEWLIALSEFNLPELKDLSEDALIPVIEKEIADRQGIDEKQNIDKDVVVASITPGALPVEIAASIGRRKFGIRGMIAGAVMMALPGALMTVALVAVLSVLRPVLIRYLLPMEIIRF